MVVDSRSKYNGGEHCLLNMLITSCRVVILVTIACIFFAT